MTEPPDVTVRTIRHEPDFLPAFSVVETHM
jgi:hypothetical protein